MVHVCVHTHQNTCTGTFTHSLTTITHNIHTQHWHTADHALPRGMVYGCHRAVALTSSL